MDPKQWRVAIVDSKITILLEFWHENVNINEVLEGQCVQSDGGFYFLENQWTPNNGVLQILIQK